MRFENMDLSYESNSGAIMVVSFVAFTIAVIVSAFYLSFEMFAIIFCFAFLPALSIITGIIWLLYRIDKNHDEIIRKLK